jgi:hypothetical protein
MPGLYTDRDRRARASAASTIGAARRPARELFELGDWNRIAESHAGRAADLFLRHHAVALFQQSDSAACSPSSSWRASKAPWSPSTATSGPAAGRARLPRARTVYMEALKRVDIALPSFDDEAVLWGDPSPEATVARLQAFGIGEIAVKNGQNSALIAAGGKRKCTFRCRRSWSRSTPPRPATASTPATSPRACTDRARRRGLGGPQARRGKGAPPRRDHAANGRRDALRRHAPRTRSMTASASEGSASPRQATWPSGRTSTSLRS